MLKASTDGTSLKPTHNHVNIQMASPIDRKAAYHGGYAISKRQLLRLNRNYELYLNTQPQGWQRSMTAIDYSSLHSGDHCVG